MRQKGKTQKDKHRAREIINWERGGESARDVSKT